MVTLVVPDDDSWWPTIGWYVAEFLTGWDYLRDEQSQRYPGSVFGPGSLKGERYRLDDEKLAATLRAYEVFPPEHRFAGRRRFKRVGISWRKGTAKTEWAAQIVYAELHPDGPVRFNGWMTNKSGDVLTDPYGVPLPIRGRPVVDPFIPMVAYNKDQTEELAYGALMTIVGEGEDAAAFDVGSERILRLDAQGMPDGRALALSGSPNANDGARTTMQHFDETHRMELPRLVDAHHTMLGNMPKRPLDDPWTLETTTAGRPGGRSVAEGTHKYARMIKDGKIKDPRLFYFHREAGPQWDMSKFNDRVEAIREATGPAGEYAPGQFEEIAAQWDDPDSDKRYLERVWCNRWTQADAQAFDYLKFENLSSPENAIPMGAYCTLGFDGARFKDATAFVLTEIKTGKQQLVAMWERPVDIPEDEEWEVPIDEVHEVWRQTHLDWRIWRGYYDPPHYVEDVAKWASERPDQVEEWWTNRRRPMSQAARNYAEAINHDQIHPRTSPDLIRHVGNAGKKETNLVDEEGRKIWILGKIAPERRFDAAMAATLSWQARIDALSNGVADEETYVPRRLDRTGVQKVKQGQTSPDVPVPPRSGMSVRYGREAVMSGR